MFPYFHIFIFPYFCKNVFFVPDNPLKWGGVIGWRDDGIYHFFFRYCGNMHFFRWDFGICHIFFRYFGIRNSFRSLIFLSFAPEITRFFIFCAKISGFTTVCAEISGFSFYFKFLSFSISFSEMRCFRNTLPRFRDFSIFSTGFRDLNRL